MGAVFCQNHKLFITTTKYAIFCLNLTITGAIMYQKTLKIILLATFASSAFAEGAAEKHEWGYSGETGPQHWKGICQTGQSQSPVDIVTTTVDSGLTPISFNYPETSLSVVNNGHAIKVTPENASITIGENTYPLLHFHFHTPSENKVNNTVFPMEMHCVHKNEAGQVVAIGILFQLGDENPFLSLIEKSLHDSVGHVQKTEKTFNINELLPNDKSYYHFEGSFTTPPCTEGIKWYVLKTPISASQSQIDRFHAVMGNNARPTQTLNERSVVEYVNQYEN